MVVEAGAVEDAAPRVAVVQRPPLDGDGGEPAVVASVVTAAEREAVVVLLCAVAAWPFAGDTLQLAAAVAVDRHEPEEDIPHRLPHLRRDRSGNSSDLPPPDTDEPSRPLRSPLYDIPTEAAVAVTDEVLAAVLCPDFQPRKVSVVLPLLLRIVLAVLLMDSPEAETVAAAVVAIAAIAVVEVRDVVAAVSLSPVAVAGTSVDLVRLLDDP
jgi:hypothetical protein